MKHMIAFTIFLVLLSLFSCKSKEEWKSRSIYQFLTDRFARPDSLTTNCDLGKYCGGNYQGIINKLDYIQGMGFNAIWISPVVENTEGSYHGYHATNFYKLNLHFGDENALRNLVNECHKRDIWVMVDVVANHVAEVGTDFGRITPFNSADHYHDWCQIKNWNNQWEVENCRLCDLPDLKQENNWVSEKLCEWIRNLVSTYNFDGLRIDTVPEVPKWFWDKFTAAAGVFQLGEVFNGNPGYVADYQNHMDSVFNYPLYYTIKESFCGSMKKLENYFFNTRKAFKDPSVLGVFVENHDNPRFLNECNDRKKFKNAVAFSLTTEGIPVFYYGGEQWYAGGYDPYNREPLWGNYNTQSEMYQMIAKINYLRNTSHFYNKETIQRYADDDFYAFTRGDILVCLTRGTGASRTMNYHGFSDGTRLCNLFDDNDCIQVNGGNLNVQLGNDPKIYIKK